jgi:hypothetical protein
VGGSVAFCYDLGLGGRGISCMLSVILSAFGLDLLIALWPTGSALPFAYDLGVGAFRIRGVLGSCAGHLYTFILANVS